ncbi:MAG: hypothetical protein M0Q19_09100, partial [Candidatus Cloacimonetes bacterium]|nr:hypothetical protein [Candidatus Cloacimonadota bacterium]
AVKNLDLFQTYYTSTHIITLSIYPKYTYIYLLSKLILSPDKQNLIPSVKRLHGKSTILDF